MDHSHHHVAGDLPEKSSNSNIKQVPYHSPPHSPNLEPQRPAHESSTPTGATTLYQPLPQQSCTVHVYCSWQSGWILTPDKASSLYTFDRTSFGKPNMRIFSGLNPNGPEIGTVNFRIFSSGINTTVHQHHILMEKNGTFSSAHTFTSAVNPALGPLKWHRSGSHWDIVLENEQKQALAQFESSPFALEKWGKLEIMPGVFQTPGLVDEVVVTALGKVEALRRQRSS